MSLHSSTSGANKRKPSWGNDSTNGSKKAKLEDARKIQSELESIEQKLSLLNEKIEQNKTPPLRQSTTPTPSTYDVIDDELQDLVDADSDSYDDDSRPAKRIAPEPSRKKPSQRTPSPPQPVGRHSKRQAKPNKFRAGIELDLLDVETAGPQSEVRPPAQRRRTNTTPRKKVAKPTLPAPQWEPILKTSNKENLGRSLNSRVVEGAGLKECTKILKDLMKHHDAWPFLQPVDPVKLNLPDYPLIVKEPMDLGTIDKKLKDGEYDSTDIFHREVKLTFDNAMLYNPVNSDVHNMAHDLWSIFEKKWQKVIDIEATMPAIKKEMLQKSLTSLTEEKARLEKQFKDLEASCSKRADDEVEDKSPALRPREEFLNVLTCTDYADRCKVCNAVNGLQDRYMAGVIKILSQELPALIKTNNPTCEVDIDALPPVVLRRLLAYVEDCMKTDMKMSGAGDADNATGSAISDSMKIETNETDDQGENPSATTQIPMEEELPLESSGTSSSDTSDTSSDDSD